MSRESEWQSAYQRRHPEKHAAKLRRYYARHAERKRAEARARRDPLKARARNLVQRAVKSEELVRGPCEVGGDCLGDVQAHHDDYAKPLEVRWLCRSHHQRLHRAARDD